MKMNRLLLLCIALGSLMGNRHVNGFSLEMGLHYCYYEVILDWSELH